MCAGSCFSVSADKEDITIEFLKKKPEILVTLQVKIQLGL